MSTQESLTLEDIPGLGPVRRQALAQAGIQNLETLLKTRVAELAAVRGIGLWQARKIREYLRQRGLVLAEDENGSVVLANARTPAEVETVAEAVKAIEETAAREIEVEEEVEMLVHALEEARAGLAGPDGKPMQAPGASAPQAAAPEEADELEEEPAAAAPESEPGAAAEAETAGPFEEEQGEEEEGEEEELEAEGRRSWQEEIRGQRERLPETALGLMEAIRQAAVTRQLTRQVTRLLITAGEFATESRELSPRKQRRASEALSEVEQALQRAVQKRAFRPADQKDLADRIRRRRKELEKLLEAAGE